MVGKLVTARDIEQLLVREQMRLRLMMKDARQIELRYQDGVIKGIELVLQEFSA